MASGLALPETALVLDTNIFTHWRNQQQYALREIADYIIRLKRPPALTSMTVFETLHGFENSAMKSGDEHIKQKRIATEKLIQSCIVLPFDHNAAAIAAYIFPRLSKSDRSKHWKDLFMASTALAYRHGIATQNKSDFELLATHLPAAHPLLRLAIWKP
ncbi:MAG TPA: type II toxin-antitoxin system VapC family toxin [Pyrinomonadaceae bacterium]|jgi:predicted nucleic acid-binding protein